MENERKRERKKGRCWFFSAAVNARKFEGTLRYAWRSLTRKGGGLILWYGIEKRIGTLSLLEAFDLGDGYNEKLRGRVGNEVSLPAADSLVCRNFKPIRCTCLAPLVLFIVNWNSGISYALSRSNLLRMYNLERERLRIVSFIWKGRYSNY